MKYYIQGINETTNLRRIKDWEEFCKLIDDSTVAINHKTERVINDKAFDLIRSKYNFKELSILSVSTSHPLAVIIKESYYREDIKNVLGRKEYE